MSEKMGVRK